MHGCNYVLIRHSIMIVGQCWFMAAASVSSGGRDDRWSDELTHVLAEALQQYNELLRGKASKAKAWKLITEAVNANVRTVYSQSCL